MFLTQSFGENVAIFLRVFHYFSILIVILLIPFVVKYKIKHAIIFLDVVCVLVVLLLSIVTGTDNLHLIYVLPVFMIISTVVRMLILLWTKFELQLVPMERRQKFFGYGGFIGTVFAILGSYTAVLILKMNFPQNYFWIFLLTSIVDGAFIVLYCMLNDSVLEKEKKTIKYIDIIKIVNNDDFKIFVKYKFWTVLGWSIAIIYAIIAIKKGYGAYEIAIMGVVYMVSYALGDLMWARIKSTFTNIIVVTRLIIIIGFVLLLFDVNMYIIFAIAGIVDAGGILADYNLVGILGKDKEMECLSILSLFDILSAVGVGIISIIMYSLSLNIAIIISIIFVMISLLYTRSLKNHEIKCKDCV